MLEFDRKLSEFLRVKASFLDGKHAAKLAQVETEQIKRDHLTSESFGRSDADLRTGVSEYRAIRFADDHRTLDVADCQDACTEFFCFAQGRDCVGSLP